MALTARQLAFVAAYSGNATAAAKKAGYRGTQRSLEVQGSRLLRIAEVREALRARAGVELQPLVATRVERQEFWTRVMKDEGAKDVDRLRASELLGRSEADFTEKVLVTGKMTLEQLVDSARAGGVPTSAPPPASSPAPDAEGDE